jgi:uncharacterized protein (TIGR03435 family)
MELSKLALFKQCRRNGVTLLVFPLVVAAVLCGRDAFAQRTAVAADLPSFEVVSIKTSNVAPDAGIGFRGGPGSPDPGQITWNVALSVVLTRAYGVAPDQISGPSWLWTQRYDIAAKIPPKTDEQQFRLMLQNLLSERFHLTLHHSAKDFPGYELVVARAGHKMKPFHPDANDATNPPSGAPPGSAATDKDGFDVLPRGQTGRISSGADMIRGTFRTTMADFAGRLSFLLHLAGDSSMANARFVDKTGLTGEFEFKIGFAKYRPAEASEASDPGPTLFSALEQQLGLRLEKDKNVRL